MSMKPTCLRDATHEIIFKKEKNKHFCKGCYDEKAIGSQAHGPLEKMRKDYGEERYNAFQAKIWEEYELDALNHTSLLHSIAYGGESKPLDTRKTMSDDDLIRRFNDIEGYDLKISVLKQLFGPTADRPKGLLIINDKPNKKGVRGSVINSSVMRRLGRLTGKVWRQERKVGLTDGEPLIHIRKTDEIFVQKTKQDKIREEKEFRLLESKTDELDEKEEEGIIAEIEDSYCDLKSTMPKDLELFFGDDWESKVSKYDLSLDVLILISKIKMLEEDLGIPASKGILATPFSHDNNALHNFDFATYRHTIWEYL